MRGNTRYSKIYTTGPYNMSDVYKRTRALRKKTFLDGLLYLDEQAEFLSDKFMPRRPLPAWEFRQRIIANPAAMSPLVVPGATTDFHTVGEYKHVLYQAKRVKDGFRARQWDLQYMDIGNVIGDLNRDMYARMKLRREFATVQCLKGMSWNNAPTHRLIRGWALRWDQAGSTPIQDILKMKLMIKLMSGRELKYMIVNSRTSNYLQSHGNIINQLIYTNKDLLVNGMVTTIKGVGIIEMDTFYKEMADEAGLLGSPARGDMRESLFDESIPGPDLKTYFMDNEALFVTGDVGNVFQTAPTGNSWLDKDHNDVKYNAWMDFCPVVKDYGRVGYLTFLTDDQFNDDDEETVTGNEYARW
jgi:hypothetical protein